MDKTSVFWIVLGLILGLCLFAVLLFLFRRKKSRKKVCGMTMDEKQHLLNEVAEPFGFAYSSEEDIFTGRLDAWQKKSGYEALFDKAAAHFHMIFDAYPVYFDYEGRTWLIEFWKGQYGINTGAEVGIYHADRIILEKERKTAHFDAVDDEEMPLIFYCLGKRRRGMFCIRRRHWWLASFRMGEFSQPKDLRLMAVLTFAEAYQAKRFYEGLKESGCPEDKCRLCCNEVQVCIDWGEYDGIISRLYRNFIQLQNQLCCLLYRFVTYPFMSTVDRLLFLYFLLPGCFRKMMRLSAHGKRYRL